MKIGGNTVKTMNLKNKSIHSLRLSADVKAQYAPRTKSSCSAQVPFKRGQLVWDHNVPFAISECRPCMGGFTSGISSQHARLRNEGAKLD